jgi:hypothetical protein
MLNLTKIIGEKVPNGGTTFAGLTTLTHVKLLGGKKNPHLGRVTKRTVANVMLFADYERAVQRKLYKEGKEGLEFEVSERAWGTRIGKSCFIEHNDHLYLEVIFKSVTSTEYFLDGQAIDKNEIQGMPVRREAEQGGLEDKVIIRTYAVESIERITIGGETFT